MLHGLGDIFPAGKVNDEMLGIKAAWLEDERREMGKGPLLSLELTVDVSMMSVVERWAGDLEKLGKKKHWIRIADSEDAWGFKIKCSTERRG